MGVHYRQHHRQADQTLESIKQYKTNQKKRAIAMFVPPPDSLAYALLGGLLAIRNAIRPIAR